MLILCNLVHQVVSVLPKKRQVLEEKLLVLKNLENALEKLEVHIPAAKQKLQTIQEKYENGQKQQTISDEDNKVRSVWTVVLYMIVHFICSVKRIHVLFY